MKLKKGFHWVIVVWYDCWLGKKDTIISQHKKYEAAEKRVVNSCGFLGIKHVDEIKGKGF